MISTRFCCCNEIIRSKRQIHEQLFENIKKLPKNLFILELKNVFDSEKIEYIYEAKYILKLFIECSLDNDDTLYDSFMNKNKLNIILPYRFIIERLQLKDEKSILKIILENIFEHDLFDIYIIYCAPVLDWNIDLFLTKKWLKNVRALSLTYSQKTADTLKNSPSNCFSSLRHLNVDYKGYNDLSPIDLCKFTKLKSLKITGKGDVHSENNSLIIDRNLYKWCKILIFEDTCVSTETVKFITMFKKLTFLKLFHCRVSITFRKKYKKQIKNSKYYLVRNPDSKQT